MAEAFLGVLLNNLNSLIEKEIGLIVGADKEMKKLSSTLTTIQAVLEDAEDKQFESKPIRNWLRKLNDLAFEIDDLLDECGIEVSKLRKKSNKLFGSLEKVLYNRKIGRRMKEIVEKLDVVAAEREKFHLRESSFERQTEVIARRAIRETGSVLNETNYVYGRDEEKEKIVDILVNHVKNSQQLSILPIIGLGGLDKTTLAQVVYNDQRIKEHFDLKMWVCVSDDFDPKNLIRAMLESGKEGESASDSMPLDSLQHRLWGKLNNKRYLLVLDDVWNEDQEDWGKLKNVLVCGSRGASILVTTRQENVADIMGTLPAHCLSVLSEEHCWLLFKQCAFGGQAEEHPNLEAIGRQMLKKCGGVPLAAKTLGGLLRFKRKEREWIHIKDSEMWNLEQKRNSILPSLRLSYRHLPLVLKRCFAYCALFPKDIEIEKEELIHLWMAHGCIWSDGIQEVEDVGDEVWDELVLRSLFQEVRVRSYDRKTVCKMHDLVHDLALSVMENQVPGTHVNNGPTAPNGKIRQILVSDRFMTLPTNIQLQVPTLTSLVNFSRVRMLIAKRWPNTEAQLSSISKLKQLRSLELFGPSIQSLPNSICDLQILQILKLNWCKNLVRLPKNMRHMDSLRHLFLEECDSLIEMPSRIGDLTSLKTLSLFIVGDKKGNQLCELEHLNLGGKLAIKPLERVKNQLDARKANLCEKPNLRELVLKWEGENASESREMMDKMVLEALKPHPNIQTSEIFGFEGKVFPLWMENATMDNVIDIKIDNCPNCLRLPPLALLPRLKSLALVKLDMIEFVSEDEVEGGNAFSSLKDLGLQFLPNLKGLLKKELREMFPNLQFLRIEECPSLKLPPLPSIKKFDVDISSHSILSSFSTLDNLTSLTVRLDKNTLTCIPNEVLESLSNLEDLWIYNAHKHIMPVEHIRCLKSLTFLHIQMREAVRCVPGEWFQQLTTLKHLLIWHCDIIEVPYEIKYLHSLESLNLASLCKMVCLPEGLQHLPSLQSLILQRLNELTLLPDWLDKCFSLKSLMIRICPKIGSLPSCIRRMTNLQELTIYGCPKLRRRCEKVKGEDWHNIAHIPNLDIF